jgi:EPS-associated MarR family transcriptional regulator
MHNEYEELKILMKLTTLNSQKAVSQDLGIAIGKVNYIVKALVKKGFIKVGNFINEEDKSRYRYLLTQKGLESKLNSAKKFVKIKQEEYERLQEVIKKYESVN